MHHLFLPRIALLLAAVALEMVSAGGCSSGTPSALPPAGNTAVEGKASSPSKATENYKLVGVVERVTPESGQVLIAHEALPGFMDAMTMPFTLKDRSQLNDVQPGDEVEGRLRVDREEGVVKDYELLDLVVTRPALKPPKRLVFSRGGVAVKEPPKRLEPGQMVPDFAMTTQEGKALRLTDLRGDVVVLTFIYTRCPLPDFCPLMDRRFSEIADKVAASPRRAGRVRLLSVSFDPEHDTPEVLRKHAQVQGARPPLWTFAVATHDELARIAAPLGLMYGPSSNEIIHNLCTAVIDPEGRLARVESGSVVRDWSAADVTKLIASLLGEKSKPAAAQ